MKNTNEQLKMRSKQKSHFIPPLAFLQVLLAALLAFAAVGGVYNLTATNTATGASLPIMATTNISGAITNITNYLVISLPQPVTFTIAPTNSGFTVQSWDFDGAGYPNHINGNNEAVMVVLTTI
jgi:hypothetical protein